MSIELRQFQDSEGYSDEEMAALLSERLNRSISVSGWRIMKGRRDAPAEWLQALSIVPQDPAHVQETADDRNAAREEFVKQQSTPQQVLPFEPNSARMTIALIYTMAGKGAAAVLQVPQVAEVWAGHAPEIAEAYIEWAKENATVAKVIAAATLGGPGGKVTLLHGSLFVQTLIVADKLKAEMFVPPSLRPEETEDDSSVDQGFYPGGDNGDEPEPKPRSRQRRKAATE